jgi:hypothetical protein
MAKRIRDVFVVNHRLDPHETELRILVEVEELTPTTQIKGRLMGPRSVYASTVEVAYPLQEVERGIELRVTIPEPSWWEPQRPFLYQGPLELWQDGELCDRVPISHGIRWVQVTSTGLRLNGRPFALRGKYVEPTCSESTLERLHDDGFNAVLTTIPESGGIDLWDAADRYGFLVLGFNEDPAHFLPWKNKLEKHPSAFAWTFYHSALAHEEGLKSPSAMVYGVASAGAMFPPNASFVLGHDEDLKDATLPKILIAKRTADVLPSRPDVIGWIEAPP